MFSFWLLFVSFKNAAVRFGGAQMMRNIKILIEVLFDFYISMLLSLMVK